MAEYHSNHRFNNFLSRLKGVRRAATPNKWYAICPAHEDSRASLTVAVGTTGCLIVSCRSSQRCSPADIVAGVGMTFADLRAEEPRQITKRFGGDRDAVCVDTFSYHYEDGEHAYDVLRYEPKDFAQRRPNPDWTPGSGLQRYLFTMAGVRMVPYHLPRLIEAPAGKWVSLVEGERKVEALEGIGMVATCHAMGSDHWKTEYAPHFAGRKVAIFYDLDPWNPTSRKRSGISWALAAAADLFGVAAVVRIVRVPDLPDDQRLDIKDWLDRTDELGPAEQRRRLWESVKGATDYYPGWEKHGGFARAAENAFRSMPAASDMNDVIDRVRARLDAAVNGVRLNSLVRDLADAAAHCRWLAETLDPTLKSQAPLLGPSDPVASTQNSEPPPPPEEPPREPQEAAQAEDAAGPQEADAEEAEVEPF